MGGTLMVFEVSKAPKTKKEFTNWYYEQVDWKDEDDFDYDNPQNASANLQNWFYEMIITFPPMNGPLAPTVEQCDDYDLWDWTVDYSISRDIIYFGFPYSKADKVYNLTRELAIKHGVGFFNVEHEDGDIILPDGTYIHEKCWKYYKIKNFLG